MAWEKIRINNSTVTAKHHINLPFHFKFEKEKVKKVTPKKYNRILTTYSHYT